MEGERELIESSTVCPVITVKQIWSHISCFENCVSFYCRSFGAIYIYYHMIFVSQNILYPMFSKILYLLIARKYIPRSISLHSIPVPQFSVINSPLPSMVLFYDIGSKAFSFIVPGIWKKLLAFLHIIDYISSSFHIVLESLFSLA